MHITSIQLTDFRNFEQAGVSFEESANLVFGRNASGKTNLLEGIQLACTGVSERTNQAVDVVRWGRDFARVAVSAVTRRRHDTLTVELTVPRSGQRRLVLNGARRSLDEGTGLAVVGFFPDDLKLVKEGPEFRRRFLDQALVQLRPRYRALRRELADVLKQRNALLRRLCGEKRAASGVGIGGLEVWDGQLAEKTAAVLVHRVWLSGRLAPHAAEHFAALSGAREIVDGPAERRSAGNVEAAATGPALTSDYQSRSLEEAAGDPEGLEPLVAALAAGEEAARGRVESATMRVIERLREAELARGVTLVGPQRDDVVLRAAGVALREYGSQGEQRTAALALKLAELDVMRSELGEWPVLLLDDVMSELDEVRRAALVRLVEDGPQSLVTSTNPGYFSPETLKSAHVIQIGDGAVVEEASGGQA